MLSAVADCKQNMTLLAVGGTWTEDLKPTLAGDKKPALADDKKNDTVQSDKLPED